MELLSWNIMSGGFSSYDSQASRPERLDLLVTAVKMVNPDFVSLIDTHRWNEVFTLDDLRGLFGYEHVYRVGLDDERLKIKGHDNGITVLARLPIRRFETARLSTRNAIRSRVLESGKEVEIFSVYLDDLSEDIRLDQTQALLKQTDLSLPTIITGDFNTFDEEDLEEANAQLDWVYSQYPELGRAMEPVLKDMARAEVTRLMKKRGFKDMGKGTGNTIPTPLFPVKIDKPILRVDYGFGTSNIGIENFEVLKGGIYNQVSDHYPIRMRVSLT